MSLAEYKRVSLYIWANKTHSILKIQTLKHVRSSKKGQKWNRILISCILIRHVPARPNVDLFKYTGEEAFVWGLYLFLEDFESFTWRLSSSLSFKTVLSSDMFKLWVGEFIIFNVTDPPASWLFQERSRHRHESKVFNESAVNKGDGNGSRRPEGDDRATDDEMPGHAGRFLRQQCVYILKF